MARVLKRPMFRRGGSTNDGIMSGLVDREQKSTGDLIGRARELTPELESLLREFTPKTRLPLGAVGAALVGGTPIRDALTAGYTDFAKRDDAREAAIRGGAAKLGISQAMAEAKPSTNILKNRRTARINLEAKLGKGNFTEEDVIKETARLNKLDEAGKDPSLKRLIAGREKEIRDDGASFGEAERQANFEYVITPKIKAGLESQNIKKTIQGTITFRDGEYQTKRKAPGIYFDPKRNNIVEITSELEVIINPPEILALL